MKKLTTLYKKDPTNLGRVINEIHPDNTWVFTQGVATRKFDGTSCAIINGLLHKRYDAKIDIKTGVYKKSIPEGAIPCQEADTKSGHHPHWVPCDRNNKADRYHFEGFDNLEIKADGTYELCGPKVQRNPENLNEHQLIKHGTHEIVLANLSFEGLKTFLTQNENDIEGIVFHHKTADKMCKIRKSDFGVRRKIKIASTT